MTLKRSLVAFFTLLTSLLMTSCGYNTLQAQDEAIKASWAEVLNQYQRRSDLVPNLVNTVKGYASHEKEVLIQVTEARAKVGSIQMDADSVNDPAALKRFSEAQGGLTSSLSRLLLVTENYPQLKANESFQYLQQRISGLENGIADRRELYNEAANLNNVRIEQFPDVLIASRFGFKAAELLQFTEAEKADVDLKSLFS